MFCTRTRACVRAQIYRICLAGRHGHALESVEQQRARTQAERSNVYTRCFFLFTPPFAANLGGQMMDGRVRAPRISYLGFMFLASGQANMPGAYLASSIAVHQAGLVWTRTRLGLIIATRNRVCGVGDSNSHPFFSFILAFMHIACG